MSIMAKQDLIRRLGNELSDILTAKDLAQVQEKIADVLSMYEVDVSSECDTTGDSEELLKAFLDAKSVEGRADRTIEHYRYVVHRAMEEMGVPVRQVTVYHLRNYLAKQKEVGLADKTIEGIRSVLCSYFGWLQKEGLITNNPTSNLAPVKCAKKVRLPYSDVEIAKLKEACSTSRDKAIVSFLMATGCRISEVCALDRNSIDFHACECTVFGKGAKERTVYFDEVTAMLLKRYLNERDDISPALFVGRGSGRMTPGGVRAMLRAVADRAGVENVHPHRFRRTLATGLIDRGMQIQEVAAILGHEKLDTTMRYVYVSQSNVKNAYIKCA